MKIERNPNLLNDILKDIETAQDKALDGLVGELQKNLSHGGTSSIGQYPAEKSGKLEESIGQITNVEGDQIVSEFSASASYAIYLDRTVGGRLKRKLVGDYMNENVGTLCDDIVKHLPM